MWGSGCNGIVVGVIASMLWLNGGLYEIVKKKGGIFEG